MCSTQCFMQPLHRHAAVTRLQYGKQQRFQRPVKCGKANVTVGGAEAAAADSTSAVHSLRYVRIVVAVFVMLFVLALVSAFGWPGLAVRTPAKPVAVPTATPSKATVKAKALPGDATALLRAMPDHVRISRASKPIPPMHGPIRTRLRNTSSPIRTATTKTPCSSPSPSGATRRRHGACRTYG